MFWISVTDRRSSGQDIVYSRKEVLFFNMASHRGDDLRKSLIYIEEAKSRISTDSASNTSQALSSHCSECGCQCSTSESDHYTFMNTRRKLLVLFTLATLALLSIVIISEQLISRHLNRFLAEPEFTVFTLQDWEKSLAEFESQIQDKSLTFVTKPGNLKVIEDGIFWSKELEAKVPPGPSEMVVQSQLQELRNRKVSEVKQPDWLHCGRELNRFVEFEDGSKACARYRSAHSEFVQGELMAFYLARLLGITNTPAVILSRVDSEQWPRESKETMEWPSNSIVALIEWIPSLTKTTMPPVLRRILSKKSGSLDLNHPDILDSLDENDFTTLVQWSNMIIFDYLTGNYDRVASMQDGADKENRPQILKETVHNLALSETTGSLWFLDNESAFLDSYALLYDEDNPRNGERFRDFHTDLLRATCLFRRKTVNRLFALVNSVDPAQLLLRFVSDNEPLFQDLPKIHENSVFRKHFQERIAEVWSWISECQLKIHY